jgi:hypothetical protein
LIITSPPVKLGVEGRDEEVTEVFPLCELMVIYPLLGYLPIAFIVLLIVTVLTSLPAVGQ